MTRSRRPPSAAPGSHVHVTPTRVTATRDRRFVDEDRTDPRTCPLVVAPEGGRSGEQNVRRDILDRFGHGAHAIAGELTVTCRPRTA